jgi:hypothetical protein
LITEHNLSSPWGNKLLVAARLTGFFCWLEDNLRPGAESALDLRQKCPFFFCRRLDEIDGDRLMPGNHSEIKAF